MIVTAEVDYIVGHLRNGHYEVEVPDEEAEDFKKLSKEEQIEYIESEGTLIIDNYYLSDTGALSDIRYE